MTGKKYKLIGRVLDDAELQKFPEAAKVPWQKDAQRKEMTAADLVEDEAIHHLDRLSLLMMTSVTLQCPVGPHDDPGLGIAVVRACSVKRVPSVAVQCSQGHWAEYPCG
jgi:hypothetical protein